MTLPSPAIKVCGITCLADARLAANAGATMVGFVDVASSPRSVAASSVAEIVAGLPATLASVLVLADTDAPDARDRVATSKAGWVQLCGREKPAAFSDFPVPILRRLAVEPDALDELERWREVASAFVLDHPAAAGGSGRQVDTDIAAGLARKAPCLLAGGLDAELVNQAVKLVQPLGVDASSRLESQPGRKCPEAVQSFVTNARAALKELR